MVIDPSDPRQQHFDSLDLMLGRDQESRDRQRAAQTETCQTGNLCWPRFICLRSRRLKGPQARRFANNYTRLFVRYPGLEDSKLGTEGMSGGEKFMMGYNIANASLDIAMSGFGGIGAISSVQDVISITRTVRAAMVSLSVSFATWEKSVDDQQQLLAGKSFKSIPIQTVNLGFLQEIK